MNRTSLKESSVLCYSNMTDGCNKTCNNNKETLINNVKRWHRFHWNFFKEFNCASVLHEFSLQIGCLVSPRKTKKILFGLSSIRSMVTTFGWRDSAAG